MDFDAQSMTVADVEDILQQIHDLDVDIAVETQKRDQSEQVFQAGGQSC